MKNNRLFSLGCFIMAGAFFVVTVGITDSFSKTRPIVANYSSGEIYQLTNHGTVVFLTFGEYSIYIGSFVMAAILAITAIFFDRRDKHN